MVWFTDKRVLASFSVRVNTEGFNYCKPAYLEQDLNMGRAEFCSSDKHYTMYQSSFEQNLYRIENCMFCSIVTYLARFISPVIYLHVQ